MIKNFDQFNEEISKKALGALALAGGLTIGGLSTDEPINRIHNKFRSYKKYGDMNLTDNLKEQGDVVLLFKMSIDEWGYSEETNSDGNRFIRVSGKSSDYCLDVDKKIIYYGVEPGFSPESTTSEIYLTKADVEEITDHIENLNDSGTKRVEEKMKMKN